MSALEQVHPLDIRLMVAIKIFAENLKFNIDYERRNRDNSLRHFNELGGWNAEPHNFRNAMAWKHEAERFSRSLHVLEDTAVDFLKEIPQELKPEIERILAPVDSREDKKAG